MPNCLTIFLYALPNLLLPSLLANVQTLIFLLVAKNKNSFAGKQKVNKLHSKCKIK
jgi:hypothetical protein